tara:strand:- start:12993 stop:14894 length:1902 start_codon:yes stop_codon:yes gene_type:complete
MAHVSDLIAGDIAEYLQQHENKTLLRFITCGSVDDGKSTLIGRLLYDSKMLFDDQLAAMESDSKRWGTQGGGVDFALLVDGLAAEREQGITIDVAYRFFSTDQRKFIVADTPGHEQYTRNMITGASTADVAVILIDARRGILTQTRRHSFLVSLIGIKQIVLAVNKMDLVGFDQATFDAIVEEYRGFAVQIGLQDITAIPLSALDGDNMISRSERTPWYKGPTLMAYLETCEVDATHLQAHPMRLPVQWVNRPNLDFRGFSGMLTSGQIRPGDRVRIQPSGKESTVKRLVAMNGDLDVAVAGQSVTVTLADEVDVSRGNVISAADSPAEVADQFECHIVWMADQPMYVGRPYRLKIGAQLVNMNITALKHKVNVNTMEHVAATELALNEIAVCNISLDRPVAFEPYDNNREMGGFIMIDRQTEQTVGAGMIHFALRRSQNIHHQHFDIDMAARAAQKGQAPVVLWFTGLSGAGKSTIANHVERQLFAMGRHSYLLDGDNVRHGLNRDLGFTDADRVENIRRVSEVARLMIDSGLIVLTAFISPFRAERIQAKQTIGAENFYEIYIDTPLSVAEERDVKGLYKKARSGQLKNFTGIDSPYEVPAAPSLTVFTENETAEQSAAKVVAFLQEKGIV